ncbi:MAG: helix-turn-helix domain-containing protein [Candidatus Poribacteria bacterium]|nr:helix-turn-helix domain-containing protein [Candidatus Poribacteria bacterium]
MEIADLKQRIAQGENAMTEFKENFDQEAIETAVAFANTNGGVILIGVSDTGEIRGITIGKETLRNWSNRIAQATEPRVALEIESVDLKEKSVLLIRISESSLKPVSVRGVCYKRVGNSNRVMSPQEIAQMHLNATGQSWDQLLVTRAGIDDIDEKKVEWYLIRRETTRNVAKPQDMSQTALLRNIDGLSDEDIPTHAGILFFSKYPQRFFQNAQLRVVRFKGISVTHPVIDRLDCSGALWEMVDAAEEFIRKNIRLLSLRTSRSFQRDDKFEYPLAALREAIINALIHRNYQKHSDVRVFIFDNRVEVINPGTFPEGVSPDTPVHEPVNPILSRFMYDIGFIERYGSGIRMMKRLSGEWGNKEPRYEFHPLQTTIIFESPIQESTFIEIDDISAQLNERQKNAFSYVQRHGQIATKEYVEINHVSRQTAYAELTDLTKKDLLTVVGKGRGTKYVRKVID